MEEEIYKPENISENENNEDSREDTSHSLPISLENIVLEEMPESEPEYSPRHASEIEVDVHYEDIYSQNSSPIAQKPVTIFDVPKIIFIVPYRNREAQKSKFLEKMAEILEDYHPSYYRIIFVHQADNRSFNRGATKNIGFMHVKNMYPNDYRSITLVFNDVDTFPSEKNVIPSYETKPNVIKHFYGFTYALGGIISVRGEDFEKLNGFPNYWAWGFEDNSIQRRALKSNVKIDRDIFYSYGNTKITQLNDEGTRVVNHSEFDRYLLATNEGIRTITQINMSPVADQLNSSIIMLNVYGFNTGMEEDKRKSFETNNMQRPFGKKVRADIFRMQFT